MGLINYSSIEDGTTIDAADVNTPLTTIYNDYNGNIDSNNLADGAITPAKWTNPYCFRAYASSSTSLVDTTDTKILFQTENYDYNSNFASSTYTAPVAGVYHFDASFLLGVTVSPVLGYCKLYVNGSEVARGSGNSPITGTSFSVSTDVLLSANNTVNVYGYQDTAGDEGTVIGSFATYFSGHLVHQV